MPHDRDQFERYVTYTVDRAAMNKYVPDNRVPYGQYPLVSGVDGRCKGCFRKYYGNRLLVDLDGVSGLGDIDAYDGLSFMQHVIWQKRGTSTVYRGFVIRWDSQDDTDNSEVGVVYSGDDGSTWTYLAVITGASTGITKTTELEAAAHGAYLMIAVDGNATKTVYWTGSAVAAVDSGPGAFDAELTAMTEASQSADTSYHLEGDGVYQFRYRFYSSTRGIYSAISAAVTVHMDQEKLTKASGAFYFSSSGGDSGLMVEGDVFDVNGRSYEYIASGSDVTIAAASAATVAAHCQALADAINGDTANNGCTARAEATSVYVEYNTRGVSGNTKTIGVTETGGNTDDISASGSTLDGGGESTGEFLEQCKAVLDFPANDAVVSGEDYDDIDGLFDTVDIFRTIRLSDIPSAQVGGIFYLEQSISKGVADTGDWYNSTTWDALQATVGTVPDAALVQTAPTNAYDPAKDTIVAPPQSGTIARYQGMTLMAEASSDDEPYDILSSSLTHTSPEYFTSYYVREGNSERGRPSRFVVAGDACFALHPGGFTHIYKPSNQRGVQYIDTLTGPGLDGKWAAHKMGNAIWMISAGLLRTMGGNDGNVVDMMGTQRLLFDDWADDIADYVSSGYDAVGNMSMFLDSVRHEILCLWHGTGAPTMLHGANFRWLTSGPDITTGKRHRIYMGTKQGLILYPDWSKAGSGTMDDLSDSYTLYGTATGGTTTTVVDSSATFHQSQLGAYVYMIDGDNAGEGRIITQVDVGGGTAYLTVNAFDNAVAYGDHYCISPVPLMATLSNVRKMDTAEVMTSFDRKKIEAVAVKFQGISGLQTGITDIMRVGAYQDNSSSLHTETCELTVSADMEDAVGAFEGPIDGLDILPYLEYLGVGSEFELTDVQFKIADVDSKGQ